MVAGGAEFCAAMHAGESGLKAWEVFAVVMEYPVSLITLRPNWLDCIMKVNTEQGMKSNGVVSFGSMRDQSWQGISCKYNCYLFDNDYSWENFFLLNRTDKPGS